MAFQTFYWKGSTAAHTNSFNWNSLGNWRVLSTTTIPPTLTSANRLPKGGDTVLFGRNYALNNILPGITAAHILSPCLFGGPGNANTSWVGATGTAAETNGTISVRARPSYPFAKLGGKLDVDILNQWKTNLMSTSYLSISPELQGWTLASGTEGIDAVWTCANWFGATGASGAIGATLYYADLGGTYINARGQWLNETKAGCLTDIFGVTGASAGCTGLNFDGSGNGILLFNTADVKEKDWLPFGNANANSDLDYRFYNYSTPTTPNDTYLSGDITVRGRFNYLRATLSATRNSNIQLIGAKINDVTLYPTTAFVLNPATHDVVATPSESASYFDTGLFYMDDVSSARKIKIGNVQNFSSAVIHGDITASGGFTCALDAFAGTTGSAVVPLGSFEFFPPYTPNDRGDIVTFGFPSSEGTKAATTITNLIGQSWQTAASNTTTIYSVSGNFTVTNFYLYTGTLQYSEALPWNTSINITNLSMYGTSVFDGTPISPQFQGLNNVTINPQSNGIVVKPGTGNQLTFYNVNSVYL